jgi:hypothetical protein
LRGSQQRVGDRGRTRDRRGDRGSAAGVRGGSRVDRQPNGSRTPVVDLNTFFHLPAQIDRTTGVAGNFPSDPKCYFDTDTQRFFLTVLQEDPAPSVRAHTLIAVSKTSDPTGDWYLYSLDATDDGLDGTPAHPNCPCFGDQPLIGADAYGFFVTTNEFGDVEGFNGAQTTRCRRGRSRPAGCRRSCSSRARRWRRACRTACSRRPRRTRASTTGRTAARSTSSPRSTPTRRPTTASPLGQTDTPDQPETTLNTNDDRMNQVV